jgi:hypothetical protein
MKSNKKHTTDCECVMCVAKREGLTKQQARLRFKHREEQMMAKQGWVIHYVLGDDDQPVNIHTHGLEEKFGHLDLQLAIAVPPDMAQGILLSAVDLIKRGLTLTPGLRVKKVLKGYDVKIVAADDNGRAVVRIIIPDAGGHLEKQDMEALYAEQYEGVVQ